MQANRLWHSRVVPLACRRSSEHSAAVQPSKPRIAGNRSKASQLDEQHYSSWTGEINTAVVEALLDKEPDNPHHVHNINR